VLEEPDYIEPGFAGPGGFVLIAGPPKAQKSFLLQGAAVAAATGGVSSIQMRTSVVRFLAPGRNEPQAAPKHI
jgi:hypothetical protein